MGSMEIVINTIQGTFVVPREKEAALIAWLEQNAAKIQRTSSVREQHGEEYTGRQLLAD
jgi:hypothetical protein